MLNSIYSTNVDQGTTGLCCSYDFMQLIDHTRFHNENERTASSPLVIRNEGSRAISVIGNLAAERRLLPGEALEIDTSLGHGVPEITFYDGGLQVDCIVPQSTALSLVRSPT